MSDANYDRIDIHRPYVDHIVLVSPSGKPMHRETDLIDVWFDSGAMPYAQWHYPFENEATVQGESSPRPSSRKAWIKRAAGSTRCTPSPRSRRIPWPTRPW
jgi:hypothetical protein